MAEPRRRVPLVPDLQASDLVLEMLRTPLDDKAIAPLDWTPSAGTAAALSPATLLASHPQENRKI
jgi:hypothetical protein